MHIGKKEMNSQENILTFLLVIKEMNLNNKIPVFIYQKNKD